eukprot:2056243-Amphidinium_carterae.1
MRILQAEANTTVCMPSYDVLKCWTTRGEDKPLTMSPRFKEGTEVKTSSCTSSTWKTKAARNK